MIQQTLLALCDPSRREILKSLKKGAKTMGEIAEKFGITPKECLMVGNDVDDDMVAQKVGMQVYLVTDNLINKASKDTSEYPSGTLADFEVYINELLG